MLCTAFTWNHSHRKVERVQAAATGVGAALAPRRLPGVLHVYYPAATAAKHYVETPHRVTSRVLKPSPRNLAAQQLERALARTVTFTIGIAYAITCTRDRVGLCVIAHTCILRLTDRVTTYYSDC